MDQIKYAKIGQLGAGFTNQIFCFITSIILAHNENKNVVIVDSFHKDLTIENSGVCISKIFDIDKINDHISKKYNIIILSKYDINFRIKHVNYGYENNSYDLTDKVINFFYEENVLRIPKKIIMNLLGGDPCFGIKKKMTIKYSLNDHDFVQVFDETLNEDIIFNLSNTTFSLTFGWIDQINRTMFDDILRNIHYNSEYDNINKKYIEKYIDADKKINVLHLRLEDDSIKHWSKINRMNETCFLKYIEHKYIELIRTYIGKDDENIILSYSTDNEVINFLKNNGYSYHFVEKNNEGREISAMIDFLISNECNNIFIGNHNPQKLNGSTFSYYVAIKLAANVKQILIDPDNITDKEHLNF